LRVDQVVAEEVLAAIQPAGVQASLLAWEQLTCGQHEKRDALTLALERARYEARRAQRQYEAVDPDNRLVAGELEKRWNTALLRVTELEQQVQAVGNETIPVTAEQKECLLHLGQRLDEAWNHPAACPELKKRILRTVLYEIVINNTEDGRAHVLVLHWQGGVHTELRVQRNRPGHHRRVTDTNVIELIRELSKVCSDATIAATLNRLGYRTGTGKTWRTHSIHNVRYHQRLPNYTKGEDWLTVEQTAKTLGVSETVIRRLIKQRVLPASQVVASTPWIIKRLDLALPSVQAAIAAVHSGRRLPKTAPDQGEFPWK
jgi:excisionase family DNA binding protein